MPGMNGFWSLRQVCPHLTTVCDCGVNLSVARQLTKGLRAGDEWRIFTKATTSPFAIVESIPALAPSIEVALAFVPWPVTRKL